MIANVHEDIQHYLESFSFPEHPWETVGFETIYENGKNHLFDFKFPWYADTESDPNGETLEQFKRMFILRFYTEQWKAETVGLFKIRLNARLTQEMPRFEELYKTLLIDYDPLINQDWTERTHDNLKGTAEEGFYSETDDDFVEDRTLADIEKTVTDDAYSGNTDHTANRTTSANTQDIHSDNPQTNFAGIDYASTMDRGQSNGTDKLTENTTTDTQEDIEVDRNLNRTEHAQGERDIGVNSTRENEKEDDRNVKTEHEGFSGASKTDNIEKFRLAVMNLNKWLCDVCDGIYPDQIYGTVGESRGKSLFMEYLGEGITLQI